jgi:hypothetical protein
MTAGDVAIPIAFPNFLIKVETPAMTVPVPECIPRMGNQIDIPATNNRVPHLGHAGILFFNGQTGLTKYFEYGRYDKAELGEVRIRKIPDVKMSNGRPTGRSLVDVLASISSQAGQHGPIVAAYIELKPTAFHLMFAYAWTRYVECKTNPNRAPYTLFWNSCNTFVQSVAIAGGAAMPRATDPRPIGYLEKVRAQYHKLDFTYPSTLSSTLLLL